MTLHPLLLATALLACACTAIAQLSIPSDGSDGALNITEDTVIDLDDAVPGTWDQNNSANAGRGVYDAEKWVVVFKYSSVNISGHTSGSPAVLDGRTLKFKNHRTHAPVVWLVQGNVTIDGILSIKGETGTNNVVDRLTPPEPGPGGFRGGALGPNGQGYGYGPGPSPGGDYNNHTGGRHALSYGNPQLIPLIGGSGGPGGSGSGSAGGGAILIACAGTFNLTGRIDADGGDWQQFNFGGGAGGGVRLIANSVIGGGVIRALNNSGAVQNNGRIRIETNFLSAAIQTTPETIKVPPANPPILWPAANAPKCSVVSVDSAPAPTDPEAPLVAAADVAIQNSNAVHILIETRDFPIEGVVQLAVIPKFAPRSWITATRIGGDINVATWRVTTVLPQGFVTLQARATQP